MICSNHIYLFIYIFIVIHLIAYMLLSQHIHKFITDSWTRSIKVSQYWHVSITEQVCHITTLEHVLGISPSLDVNVYIM